MSTVESNSMENTLQISFLDKFKAVIRLTRWREHVPYTIPAVVAGAMLAISQTNQTPDIRLLFVVIANIFAQSYAFMINDVADAPDDALVPHKKARNVISNGTLTYREGMVWTWGTFFIALALFATGGWWTLLLGALQLGLCYVYSAYPFRWKARLVTDVVSHALMLSALLVMTGFFTYSNTPNNAWLIFVGAFLYSAYGQFFNQIDDYEVDKAAGLRNTVVMLGVTGTRILMYGCIIGAFVTTLIAIAMGMFPSWLAPVALIAMLTSALFVWETDMRGNRAEGSGLLQKPALVVANIVMLMWVAQSLGLLTF
jgi:4-hydroxybenzoate polyprenyltransferase